MPGFIAHLSFGEQSLSFIEFAETRKIIDSHQTTFNLGLQGPDIFFYHIPAYLFYSQNIGNVMHRSDVMLFFDRLFDARNAVEDSHDRNICDAYILGFIGHYSLDVACHPYIYCKSEHINNLKRGGKYDFGKHVSLETDIDHVLLDHYKKLKPSDFDYAAAVRPTSHEQDVIAKLLFKALINTYGDKCIRLGTIKNAIKSFINLNHAMHDPTGHKKRNLRHIEQTLFKYAFISSMIPSDNIIKYQDPCNLEHNEWHNPWNPRRKRTESFLDLFNHAMPNYIECIDLYSKAVGITDFSGLDLDSIAETNNYLRYRNLLLMSLSDFSYLTGLPL
ncbi:Zinc dependent phospholipase C [Pseudobutyrivibrio sp. 49]|uniref:zinc dependent phospholipase C family protein n=1 Tax=Pseudobutyrivibrio sp. 49 TaxID=1855344 RepID=UPI0008878329|nr:zinc dependent phospholipase C family protein [Pseudobutyrivibrio sp. 49]SDI86504.1 Zinc dependent phospholipase C [Pseudobutyrivibrio sp. 49]